MGAIIPNNAETTECVFDEWDFSCYRSIVNASGNNCWDKHLVQFYQRGLLSCYMLLFMKSIMCV